jgi:hypothetical protein
LPRAYRAARTHLGLYALKLDGGTQHAINCIKVTKNGVLPVAILGDEVDVHNIKVSSLEIDDDSTPGGGVKPTKSSFADVNGDGITDPVEHLAWSLLLRHPWRSRGG